MSLLNFLDPLLNLGTHISSSIQNENQRQRQNRFNAEQAQLNRDFQSQQAEIARDWQEQQYNLYSSPSAMVRQYEDAGLNPSLMHNNSLQGSTGSSPSPSGATASGSALGSPIQHFSGIVSDFLGLKKLDAEIDNIYADSEAKRAAAAESGSRIDLNKEKISEVKQNIRNLIQVEKNDKVKNGLLVVQELLSREDVKLKKGQQVSIMYDNMKREFEQTFKDKYGFYPEASLVKSSLGILSSFMHNIAAPVTKSAIDYVKNFFKQ